MQRTWQNAILLTLFGAAIATACVVGEDTDGPDDDDGGSGGFGGTSKGGSTAKGGGTAKGGSSGSTGTGGDTGTAGDTGTNGGAPAVSAMCDAANAGGAGGEMVTGNPYPDCDPTDPNDECQTCIQMQCETECMNCNAFDPYNVCGYGGPAEYAGDGGGEFLCWQECMNEKVDIGAGGGGGSSGLPDASDLTMFQDCLDECATPACDGLPGDETNALTSCVFEQCGDGICIY